MKPRKEYMYTDLRDLKGSEKRKWKKAIEEQTGYDFDELSENEPTMISRDEFEDYAQELAFDIGAIDGNQNWPHNCIDWEEAASQLEQDYTSVDVDGVEYLFRAY